MCVLCVCVCVCVWGVGVCVCVCVRVCVCVCVCGLAELFNVTPAGTVKKKYFIYTKVLTTGVLPSGFHLTPFYTAPVFVSMFVA